MRGCVRDPPVRNAHPHLPSHYSLEWPCQIFWVWHRRPPPTSTHPRSVSSDSQPWGQGAPEHSCKSVPIAPSPGAMAGSCLPGCQLFLSPRCSLSYKTERTWKLKQEEQRAGPEGSRGSYGETAQPEGAHYFLVLSGRHIRLGKEHLHITRHSNPAFSWLPKAPPHLLKAVATLARQQHGSFSQALHRMWGAEARHSMWPQGGRCPREREGLPQGHPARPLSEQLAFPEPLPREEIRAARAQGYSQKQRELVPLPQPHHQKPKAFPPLRKLSAWTSGRRRAGGEAAWGRWGMAGRLEVMATAKTPLCCGVLGRKCRVRGQAGEWVSPGWMEWLLSWKPGFWLLGLVRQAGKCCPWRSRENVLTLKKS